MGNPNVRGSGFTAARLWHTVTALWGGTEAKKAPAVKRTDTLRLSETEKEYILSGRLTRLDGGRVLLAQAINIERCLVEFLTGRDDGFPWSRDRVAHGLNLVNNHVKDKRVLVVPAYSVNAFLFKLLGAKEVVGLEADPVSLAWLKAIAANFAYEQIGEIFMALARYPEEDSFLRVLPHLNAAGKEAELIRRVQDAVRRNEGAGSPLAGISFEQKKLGSNDLAKADFDFVYVPFLIGIDKGIETDEGALKALQDIRKLLKPGGRLMITPFTDSDEVILGMYGSRQNPDLIQHLQEIIPKNLFRLVDETNLLDAKVAIFEAI